MTDEKEQKQKIEVKSDNNFTFYFWTAGWLFTYGISGGIANIAMMDTFHKIASLIMSWLAWPYYLGLFLAK